MVSTRSTLSKASITVKPEYTLTMHTIELHATREADKTLTN